MVKIMRIVFEVASCSWKDDEDGGKDENGGQEFDIERIGKDESLNENQRNILRSIMLRKHYGGMGW